MMQHSEMIGVRIIPTRMGTRILFELCQLNLKDHPHAYGDKHNVFHQICYLLGSSPRVWGQDPYEYVNQNSMGIIPTRMGTSILLTSVGHGYEDHPHAYGDKQILCIHLTLSLGSSPRVWGQASSSSSSTSLLRIIPTRMGTRRGTNSTTTGVKDHPHAYGDKFYFYKILQPN